ncbi:MAG TPA: phosphohistidine phosphatase SixA [Kiloniellales bacterium]
MRLYLVRHGDALTPDVDPERRLSEAGHRQVARMAAFLSGHGVAVQRVLHSGKPRAEQTAATLAAAVAPATVPEARDGLSPNDPVEPLAAEIADWREDSLIAGHLPHLARLATLLLTGRNVPTGLDFEPAAAACLDRGEDGAWSLVWLVGPSLL